jgi:hypothetical protein
MSVELLPLNTPVNAISGTASANTASKTGGTAGPQGLWNRMGGLDGMGRIFDGIGNIGRLYAAIQGVKLGKQQLSFARDAFNTNTANQTQTYNTSLEDRIRARYNTEGRSSTEADGYLDQNRLQHRPL